MSSIKKTETYVAFLRGINVGGNHKLPMVELKKVLEGLGFTNIITILNSGNVIFDSIISAPENIEKTITDALEKTFGFPVPTIIRSSKKIHQLYNTSPFQDIIITKDIRLYISLLKDSPELEPELPWGNEDKSCRIILSKEKMVLSVLDLAIGNTPSAMKAIESFYSKNITTRNWKTIERIITKLDAGR